MYYVRNVNYSLYVCRSITHIKTLKKNNDGYITKSIHSFE